MREIKFRAWDKDNSEMFTYENIGDVIFGLENDGTVSLFICDSEESPNVEIMQLIGDKNGVDIYEGDIVNLSHLVRKSSTPLRPAIVSASFNEGIKLKAVDNGSTYGTAFLGEIIGNIYGNPELLEVVC